MKCSGEMIAQLKEIDICYEIFGEDNNVPVLLIAGLGRQMISWDESFCSKLAGKGFKVIRFDNRDSGRSSKLINLDNPSLMAILSQLEKGKDPKVPYKLEDMVTDTLQLLDFLKIESAHMIGISLGGMIAQLIAINYPQRIRTMTSMMSSTGNPEMPPPTPEVIEHLIKPSVKTKENFIERAVESYKLMTGSKYPVDEQSERKKALRSYERCHYPDGHARQNAAILVSGNRKEALKNIKVPTLIIHGNEDPFVNVKCGIDTADAIPGANIKIVEGMGHRLHVGSWGEVIDPIEDLITCHELKQMKKG